MAGIYVHIPFCVKKCAYCDFISFEQLNFIAPYFEALFAELALVADGVSHIGFDTIFIGGGTPTVVSEDYIGRLIELIMDNFTVLGNAEITIECNPGTVDENKLKAYKRFGINRISIGVQSLDDDILHDIGRIHTRQCAIECFKMARDAGFDNISVDLMYGLPGQSVDAYISTVSDIVKLSPEHISAYSLILEQGTRLYDDVANGIKSISCEDDVCDMEIYGRALLEKAGYTRYEVSNYAKRLKECRHNINYWQNGEYLGVGVAAHSSLRRKLLTRSFNTSNLHEYIKKTSQGCLPLLGEEAVPIKDEMFECIMLGLRMISGVGRDDFLNRFGVSLEKVYKRPIDELVRLRWLVIDELGMRLTEKGLDLQNMALLRFME